MLTCVNEVVYSCNSCSKTFSRKDNLNRHFKICKGKKVELVCDYCHKEYSTDYNLKRHLEICGDNNKKKNKKHETPKCSKSYSEEDKLEQHLETCGKSKSCLTQKSTHKQQVNPQADHSPCEAPPELEEQSQLCMFLEYYVEEEKLHRFNQSTPLVRVSFGTSVSMSCFVFSFCCCL